MSHRPRVYLVLLDKDDFELSDTPPTNPLKVGFLAVSTEYHLVPTTRSWYDSNNKPAYVFAGICSTDLKKALECYRKLMEKGP